MMYIREKKLTKGVSDQINLPARLSASTGKTVSLLPTASDAKKVMPNVVATIALSRLLDNRMFIATLEASETARSAKPVLVKYNSERSPSTS